MEKKLFAASLAPPHRREEPRAALGHQRESPGTSGAAYTSPERPDGCARLRCEICVAGKGLRLFEYSVVLTLKISYFTVLQYIVPS